MPRALRFAAVSLALAQAIACDEVPQTVQSGTGRALTLVAGDGARDTISTTFAQGLVVELRAADGSAARGVYVLFNNVGAGGVQVSPASVADAPFTAGVSVPTDAQGRAVVRLRFGTTAGEARLAVTVPSFGLSDTAHFTVLAGAAAGITLQPRDTTIQVGGSFRLRAAVVDRGGNARGDPISFESSSPAAVTVTTTGQVTGVASGSATLRVSASAGSRVLKDSTSVAVVPRG